jgi:LMBR1 domain-containing protein 1
VYVMAVQSIIGMPSESPLLSPCIFYPCECHLDTSRCRVYNTANMLMLCWANCVAAPLGWILFMVFAGVGVLAAPVDWIFQFIGRPQSIITRSEYMQRGRVLAQRAKQIMVSLAVVVP